jgi:hypothetical protein
MYILKMISIQEKYNFFKTLNILQNKRRHHFWPAVMQSPLGQEKTKNI